MEIIKQAIWTLASNERGVYSSLATIWPQAQVFEEEQSFFFNQRSDMLLTQGIQINTYVPQTDAENNLIYSLQ